MDRHEYVTFPALMPRADRTGTRARSTIFEKSHSALINPVYPKLHCGGTAKNRI